MSKSFFPFRAKSLCALTLVAAATGAPLHALTININPDAGLSANPQALAAFQAAAAEWSNRLSDPITINISAGLDDLGNNRVIGQTGSSEVSAPFDTIRNQMVAEATGKPNGNAAATQLPTFANYSANVTLGTGTSLSGNMVLTTANAKALGFSVNTASDATITFNSRFSFNYTGHPDGTQEDFQTVAAHEIGHALGFISSVDDADGGVTSLSPAPLDLYRFKTGNAPSGNTFSSMARDLTAGSADVTSDGTLTLGMSTGVAHGDGNQASHWKADELSGTYLGIMDPTLANGQVEPVGDNDLFAMNLIGYDLVAVPEPTTLLAGVACGVVLLRRARRSIRKTDRAV